MHLSLATKESGYGYLSKHKWSYYSSNTRRVAGMPLHQVTLGVIQQGETSSYIILMRMEIQKSISSRRSV